MDKVFLKDKDGNRVLPITHLSAVQDNSGTPLTTILADMQDDISEGGGAGTIDYTEEATQITDIDATLATTALRKTAQSLTASEKTQVRTNLGLDSAYIAAATEANLLKTVAQELSAAQIAQVKTNLGLDASYVAASDITDVLRSSAQTLTSTQKTQVKTNLDLDSSYLTIAAQSLTTAQKTQVKTNLGITEYDASQTRSITFSTSEPTSSDGSDGDIWIVYEAS